MTTSDPSPTGHESEEPANAAPEAPGTGGSHSAPRPVPSIDPQTGRVTAPATEPFGQEPDTAPLPAAPDPAYPPPSGTGGLTRVSALGGSAINPAASSPAASVQASDPAAQETFGASAPAPYPAGSGDAYPAQAPVAEPEPAATAPLPMAAPEVTTTQVVPAGAPIAGANGLGGSTAGRLASEQREPSPEPEWPAEPAKRTSAHLWSVLALLVLAPITWFLLTDGALRTFYSLQDVTDSPNLAGLLSLAGGIAGLLVIALVTRASSLGAWIWGGLIAAVGLTFLIIPQTLTQWMVDSRDSFLVVHEGFGTNLYNYLLDTGRSGLLLTYGVVLLLFALVAHAARRSGRTEERIRAEYEAVQ